MTPNVNRQAIFLDVDGTLVDARGHVPDSAKRAIREARADGHLVLLCTGRSPVELWPELRAVGFDGLVGISGAFVQVNREVLAHQSFDAGQVEHAVRFLDALGINYYFEGADVLYGSMGFKAHLNGLLAGTGADEPALAALKQGAFAFVDEVKPAAIPSGTRLSKALFYSRDGVSFNEIQQELGKTMDVVRSSIPWYGPDSGELTIPGVHKATGIELILRHMHVDRVDTLALGDGYNDVEMLQHVGTGIAMGNAPDAVKQIANEVTTTPEEDGILRAFVLHGLAHRT